MNNTITLYDYVAHQAPLESNELLRKYGYVPVNQIQVISGRLKDVVKQYKEEALKDIAKIHPDAQLLKEAYDEKVNMPKTFAESNSATNQTSSTKEILQELKSVIEKPVEKVQNMSNQNMLLLLGVALVVVIAIKK